MDEDLIMIVEKNLNDYRRKMFKAGKNLDRKASITRATAIKLIKFIGGERQAVKKDGDRNDGNGFSVKDLEKAFNGGSELINQEWHEAEFCTGEGCRCGGVKLNYNSFDKWLSINYTKQKIIKC